MNEEFKSLIIGLICGFLLCFFIGITFEDFRPLFGYELSTQDIMDERTVLTCRTFFINSTDCFEVYGDIRQ